MDHNKRPYMGHVYTRRTLQVGDDGFMEFKEEDVICISVSVTKTWAYFKNKTNGGLEKSVDIKPGTVGNSWPSWAYSSDPSKPMEKNQKMAVTFIHKQKEKNWKRRRI